MNPKTYTKILPLATIITACSGEEFPGYGGQYLLESVSVTDPTFLGLLQPAPNLNIINRMEHHGGYFTHFLQLGFFSRSRPEQFATGSAAFTLDSLTRIDTVAWPNNGFDGCQMYSEGVAGTSECNHEYVYHLFLAPTPESEMLRKVYPGKGEYIGKDPVTKMDLYETLSNPQEVELNENAVNAWNNTIDSNGGIILNFRICRHHYLDYSKCSNDNRPFDTRGEACLFMTYKSFYEEKEEDIRKLSVNDALANTLPAMKVLGGLISGVSSK